MINDADANPGGSAVAPPNLKTQASEDIGNVTDKARHDLDAIKHLAQDDVRELGQQASEKVSEAKDKVKSFAADQKDFAANQISGVASAITKVADELENTDQSTVARYARDLASGISNFGKTVQDHESDELMALAQDFGRKQPIAFLGAAALAGFVASRFAMASAHRRESKPTNGGAQAEGSPAFDRTSAPNRTGGE